MNPFQGEPLIAQVILWIVATMPIWAPLWLLFIIYLWEKSLWDE